MEGLAVSVNAGRVRPRPMGQDEALVVREEVVIENSHGRDVNVSLLSERHADVEETDPCFVQMLFNPFGPITGAS